MTQHYKHIEEPDWLRTIAQDSMLNKRDVAEVFGLRPESLTILIREHNFPKADTLLMGVQNKSNQWLVSTIRAEIVRRNNIKMKPSTSSN